MVISKWILSQTCPRKYKLQIIICLYLNKSFLVSRSMNVFVNDQFFNAQ